MRPRPRPMLSQKSWKIGDICEARYTEDGLWYIARIDDVSNDGQFLVNYIEYGNSEILRSDSLRPRGFYGQ